MVLIRVFVFLNSWKTVVVWAFVHFRARTGWNTPFPRRLVSLHHVSWAASNVSVHHAHWAHLWVKVFKWVSTLIRFNAIIQDPWQATESPQSGSRYLLCLLSILPVKPFMPVKPSNPAPAACSHLWPLAAVVALWKLAILLFMNISLYLSNSRTFKNERYWSCNKNGKVQQKLHSNIILGNSLWRLINNVGASLGSPVDPSRVASVRSAISALLMWDPADAGWLWMFKKTGVGGNAFMKQRRADIENNTYNVKHVLFGSG